MNLLERLAYEQEYKETRAKLEQRPISSTTRPAPAMRVLPPDFTDILDAMHEYRGY